MASIDFITSNPATDAFQKAERLTRENDLSDLKLASGQREESEKQQTLPTRLRRLEADTSSAETGAQVAKDEAPYAAPIKAAGLRSANANAQNTELGSFYKSLELINAGDVEGAKEVARRTGHNIPDSVINDSDTRSAITTAAKRAQELYPNRPKDQATYITGYVADMQKRKSEGGRANDPTAPYSVTDAPAPQETSDFKSRWDLLPATRANAETGQPEQGYIHHDKTTGDSEFVSGTTLSGKSGGGGGRKITGTEAIIENLRQENPKLSYSEALSIAKRSGQSADVLTLRKEGLALSAAKADTNYLTNPSQTIEKYRKQYGLGAAPGPQASRAVGPDETITRIDTTPAPLPASPARPGQMTPGDGGKPLPLQLPPTPQGVPPGSSYSPSRRMWRSADGQVFDENGIPVLTQ